MTSIIDILLRFKKSGNGAEEAAEETQKLGRSINDIQKELKGLNKQLSAAELGSDEFGKLVKQTNALEKELKQAKRAAKGLDDELDDIGKGASGAGQGLSVLDIAAGNLAAGGLLSLADGLGSVVGMTLDWGRASVNAGSVALESADLLNTILGPAYSDYLMRLEDVEDQTGRSADSLAQNSTLLLNFLGSQGFAVEQISSLGSEFAALALDLESATDQAGAIDAIISGISGESEPLKRFGVDAREAALQQVALREGIISVEGPLNQQERTLAIMAQIYEQQAVSIGNASDTADSYANQQRQINELFEDLNRDVGKTAVEVLQPAQKEFLNLARVVLPEVEGSISSVLLGFQELATAPETAERVENFFKGLSVVTGSYERQIRDVITANIQEANSVEDLQDYYKTLLSQRRELRKLEDGRIDIGADATLQIAEQLALTAGSLQEFEDAVNSLQSAGQGDFNLYRVIGFENGVADFEGFREEILLTQSTLEAASFDRALMQNTGGFVDFNALVMESAEAAGDFDRALKNSNNTLSGLDFSSVADVDFSNINSFYGAVDANTQTAIDDIQNLGSVFGDLSETINGLNTSSILGVAGQAETSAVGFFAEGLEGQTDVDINDQVSVLNELDYTQDQIATAIRTNLNAAVGEFGLAMLDAKVPFDEALDTVLELQEVINSSDNPLDLIDGDVLDLDGRLEALAEKTFMPTVEIQFVGTEQLDAIEAQLNRIAGVDISGAEFANGGAIGGPSSARERRR
ncbi:MAG: hypothetical protein AAF902_02080 [Chloroflexota bacterium]